jgi:TP901 family phage tail tape measure protein
MAIRGMRGGVRIPIITEFDDKAIKKFSTSMTSLGKNLTKTVTLPILAIGAAAVKMSMDFETSMGKITGLVGVAADQTKLMGDEAIQMASKYGKSATEAANALFFITSAGLRGRDAMDVLESSLKASAIGLGDTATIADVLTSAVNAYGSDVLSSAKATDILVAAVREGKLEASELAGSIGSVLPVSSALGVGLGDVAGAMAALSRTGTNAATAATQLRGILFGILKPTSQANEELKKYGLSAQGLRQQLREQGLLATLKTLTGTLGDNEESIAKVFGNVRALSGLMDLMGANVESTEAIFKATNNTLGDTDAAMAVIAETSGFKMNVAINTLKNSLISFGDIIGPAVTKAADFVRVLAERFSNLDAATKKQIVVFLGVAAAAGPVLLIFAALIRAVLTLSKVFALLGLAVVKIPLTIFLLIGALRMASDEQAKLGKNTRSIWQFIFEIIKNATVGIVELIDLQKFQLRILAATGDFAQRKLNNAFRIIGGLPTEVLPSFKEFIDMNVKMESTSVRVNDAFDKLGGGIKETFTQISNDVKGLDTMATEAKQAIADIEAELAALSQETVNTEGKSKKLKDAIKALRQEMVKIKTEAVNALKSSLDEAQKKLEDARGKFNAFKDAISGSITGIINFGKAAENDNFLTGLTEQANAATTFADRVKKLIQMGLSERAIQQVLSAGHEAGLKIADEIISGGSAVVDQVNTLVAAVATVAEQVGIDGAKQFYQAGIDQGQALVNGILDALRQAQAELQAAIKAAAAGSGEIRPFGARATGILDAIGGIKNKQKQQSALDAFQKAFASDNKFTKKEAASIKSKFKLAKGGIVLGPTNALIGEAGPEAVIPLSGANSAGSSMGTTINITVNAGIGTNGNQVGQQIVEAIKRYERASGPVFSKA